MKTIGGDTPKGGLSFADARAAAPRAARDDRLALTLALAVRERDGNAAQLAEKQSACGEGCDCPSCGAVARAADTGEILSRQAAAPPGPWVEVRPLASGRRRVGNVAAVMMLARLEQLGRPPPYPNPGNQVSPQFATARLANQQKLSSTSIAIIRAVLNLTPSEDFDQEIFQAIVQLQPAITQALGVVDEPTMELIVQKALRMGMLEHAVYLVDDFFDLEMSDSVLSVRVDLTLPGKAQKTMQGNLAIVTVGQQAFNGGANGLRDTIRSVISKQKAPPKKNAPAHLTAAEATEATAANNAQFHDPRSAQAIREAIGATMSEDLGDEFSQWVADYQDRDPYLAVTGKIDDPTFFEIVERILVRRRYDSALRVIVDKYHVGRAALDIRYNPGLKSDFELLHRSTPGPASIDFGPTTFAQPLAGIVHTVVDAHWQAHARLMGMDELQQMFLGMFAEVTSDGTDEEDFAAFESDVTGLLGLWDVMSDDDHALFSDRFRHVRDRVDTRYLKRGLIDAPLQKRINKEFDKLPAP